MIVMLKTQISASCDNIHLWDNDAPVDIIFADLDREVDPETFDIYRHVSLEIAIAKHYGLDASNVIVVDGDCSCDCYDQLLELGDGRYMLVGTADEELNND